MEERARYRSTHNFYFYFPAGIKRPTPEREYFAARAAGCIFMYILGGGIMYLRITGNTRVINPGGRWGPGAGGRRED